MDEMDLRLIQLLMMDSRTPYRRLAEELGVSLQAVHRRIQGMVESRIIQGFTASLSPSYLDAVGVDVLGKCNSPAIDRTIQDLGRSEFIGDILVGAGNTLVITGLLRKTSDLEPFLELIKDKGAMSDLWVGLQSFGLAGKEKVNEDSDQGHLTPLDFRIVYSLRADARKQIGEIADEIGISARTVARRLNSMVSGRKISLFIKWYPGMSSGTISYSHIILKEGTDKRELATRLMQRYSPRIVFLRSYGNHPNLLGTIIWTPTVVDLSELTSAVSKEPGIMGMVPNVLLRKFAFGNWVDDLIDTKVAAQERKKDAPLKRTPG